MVPPTRRRHLDVRRGTLARPKKQIETLISDTNYSLSVLRRLKKLMSSHELRMLAEGLIMSKLRYCATVYGSEWIRLTDDDALSSMQYEIQKVQNKALRIITNHKCSDHVRIAEMLEQMGWLSINQMVANASLIKMWKAKAFKVPYIESLLKVTHHENRNLRSNTQNVHESTVDEPFANMTSKLYNISTENFKKTNLIINAKSEAKKLVKKLPI